MIRLGSGFFDTTYKTEGTKKKEKLHKLDFKI